MPTPLNKFVWFVLAPGLMFLAGCGEEQSDASGSGGEEAVDSAVVAPGDMPSIYVDQRLVRVDPVRGTNNQLRNYNFRLDLCQEAGLPTRPLSDEEVSKIGTTRVQRWIMPDRAAYRIETFGFGTPGPMVGPGNRTCEFHFGSVGSHVYFDHERIVSIGLGDNEKIISEPKPWLLDRSYSRTFDAALEQELAEIDRHAVTGPPVQETAAGAPCLRWESSFNGDSGSSYCVWSGGTLWGFHISPLVGPMTADNVDLFGIVLEQQPGAPVFVRVTTQQFTVGASFDESEMMPRPSSTL